MKEYNYTTDIKPSIATVPKFLSANDFSYAVDFAQHVPYVWGETDDGREKPTGMGYDIMVEMIGVGELDNGEIIPDSERNIAAINKLQAGADPKVFTNIVKDYINSITGQGLYKDCDSKKGSFNMKCDVYD